MRCLESQDNGRGARKTYLALIGGAVLVLAGSRGGFGGAFRSRFVTSMDEAARSLPVVGGVRLRLRVRRPGSLEAEDFRCGGVAASARARCPGEREQADEACDRDAVGA